MTRNDGSVRYWAGEAYLAVGGNGVAALDVTLAPAVVDAVWSVLRLGGGLGEVLQVLTGAFGTSLTSIPSFAVAVHGDEGLHVAVRGPWVARVASVTGDHEITGVGVTTWSERLVAGPSSITVHALGSQEGAPTFPLDSGVARASGLIATFDDDLHPAVVPAQVTTATSLPVLSPPVLPEPVLPEPVEIPPAQVHPPQVHPAQVQEAPTFPARVEPVPGGTPSGTPSVEVPREATLTSVELVELTRADVPDDGYDHLWGSTMIRSVEDAAIRIDPEEEPAPAPSPVATPPVVVSPPPEVGPTGPTGASWLPPLLIGEVPLDDRQSREVVTEIAVGLPDAGVPGLGDHDGETVIGFSRSQLPADLRSPLPEIGAVPTGDVRRSRGRVQLSTGGEIDLDRPLVVGRKPRTSRTGPGELPRLVTVPSPDHDISRSHLEVRLEDLHVLVVDLGATNGTTLLRPGQPPVRLHPHEAVLVVSGDVVDLGSSVQLTFEVNS